MKKVTSRSLGNKLERELWARAAGRCQFNGCNRLLYKSSVTQESINASQRAHIYSFSINGPRGQGSYEDNTDNINELSNLMLVCHPCHQTIDLEENTQKYSAAQLQSWKLEHEQRIKIVTGIDSDKKSHVVVYGANIGMEASPIDYTKCVRAMFPNRYPAEERPQVLSMNSALRDHNADYWQAEVSNLYAIFERRIVPLIETDDCKHYSLFAFAPQPLLILLGKLFTDKIFLETYQLHREPVPGWEWQDDPDNFEFITHLPENCEDPPALLISLSDHINYDRIYKDIGEETSIWELTIKVPGNDFLKSKSQLSLFRNKIRELMVAIKQHHGNTTPLSIFPAMPIACAVELGRARMPKAEMPWVIYDQNSKANGFIKTIEIGGVEK
jgi:hypothetical protein